MAAQELIVALIVLACASYAAWTLMPSAARRGLALRALKLPLPAALARPFRKAAQPAGACGGCGGCGDGADKPVAKAIHTVTLHRASVSSRRSPG
ncbi:MAG TPA: DUF6587 family protein [Albitalea sp.]|nr:DUF6587 family protein [Albitalea sp.]